MDNNIKEKQIINLEDGKNLTMNGVKFIETFDPEYILLDTSLGNISVEGSEMKIESLNDVNGNIVIKGDIKGIFRSEEKSKKNGFFGKIFNKWITLIHPDY